MTSTFREKQSQDSNSGLLTLESCLNHRTPPPCASSGFRTASSGVCDHPTPDPGSGEEEGQGTDSLGLVSV